jgi:AcrR family transcriptional regulator
MTPKKQEDWLRAGIDELLQAGGPQGLTIDALCRRLKVTKGSFYHHFDGYDDFKRKLLTFYEDTGTEQIIDRLDALPTALQKLHALLWELVRYSELTMLNVDVVIRAWALQDEAVQAVQTRVDGRRLAYVKKLCQEIIGDERQGERLAQMLYAILVGSEQMQPLIVGDTLRVLFDEALRFYGAAPLEEKNESG